MAPYLFSAIAYLEQLLAFATRHSISDIHIEPQAEAWQIRCRQDGLLRHYDALAIDEGQSLVGRIKVLSHCDIAEKRLPQDGAFRHSGQDFRLSTCPMVYGEKLVLRCFAAAHQHLALHQLGLSDTQLQLVTQYLHQTHGLILVTGPTGSGKSSTLYSALQYLHNSELNITTVEDPVEVYLPGINQIPIQTKAGLHFAQALRALLRQDPDIVMIGEMRDVETVEIALHAAQTGHLVLSTLHTNNSYEAIIRLRQMGIAPYQISSSVRLIIAQRLIRILCRTCFDRQTQGCDACHRGYVGRTGIYEVMAMTDNLASLIQQQAHRSQLQAYQRDQEIVNLWQHGLSKVAAGLTDESELRRVAEPDI